MAELEPYLREGMGQHWVAHYITSCFFQIILLLFNSSCLDHKVLSKGDLFFKNPCCLQGMDYISIWNGSVSVRIKLVLRTGQGYLIRCPGWEWRLLDPGMGSCPERIASLTSVVAATCLPVAGHHRSFFFSLRMFANEAFY